jgi:phosphate transport system permease protein
MQSFRGNGVSFIWLSASMTALCILMIAGLLGFILVKGLGVFWPREIVEIELMNGTKLLGEVWNREPVPDSPTDKPRYRQRMKIGNRDFFGLDFRWIDEQDIHHRRLPDSAVAVERRAWGDFIGYLSELRREDAVIAKGAWPAAEALASRLGPSREIYQNILKLEKEQIGEVNRALEKNRLQIIRLALSEDTTQAVTQEKLQKLRLRKNSLQTAYDGLEEQLMALRAQSQSERMLLQAVDGTTKAWPLVDIVRVYHPNTLSKLDKATLYCQRIWAFLSEEPREANLEGGIFPAIFGTVLMVIIMSLAVVPLGVMAAIYMREFARQGPFLRAVRIAVNNLAGVPSIVFGVFGLGFFIYIVGGAIDQLFYAEALPTPTFGTGGILWASLTLALLTVPVVIVAVEEGLAAVPTHIREGSIALGATRIETLFRLVLPAASPGILTGLILAMARAAGEVAPLMITGVVKLAPTLPIDSRFPFLHLERKFMHLGFHIYDVGFQSPNVEAAVPMVFATALLLILIIICLNLLAIKLRSRLRRRFSLGQL